MPPSLGLTEFSFEAKLLSQLLNPLLLLLLIFYQSILLLFGQL